MRSRLLGSILFLIFSVFVMVAGAVLTVTLVFAVFGIPLIIIGAFMVLFSLIGMVFGTLGDAFALIRRLTKPKKKTKVIDVEKKDGVYVAK